jgi:transcription termination factor Rho
VLRRVLNPRSPVEAMELLITYVEKSRNNAEFFTNMNQL